MDKIRNRIKRYVLILMIRSDCRHAVDPSTSKSWVLVFVMARFLCSALVSCLLLLPVFVFFLLACVPLVNEPLRVSVCFLPSWFPWFLFLIIFSLGLSLTWFCSSSFCRLHFLDSSVVSKARLQFIHLPASVSFKYIYNVISHVRLILT